MRDSRHPLQPVRDADLMVVDCAPTGAHHPAHSEYTPAKVCGKKSNPEIQEHLLPLLLVYCIIFKRHSSISHHHSFLHRHSLPSPSLLPQSIPRPLGLPALALIASVSPTNSRKTSVLFVGIDLTPRPAVPNVNIDTPLVILRLLSLLDLGPIRSNVIGILSPQV